jgi:hypothetical protein
MEAGLPPSRRLAIALEFVGDQRLNLLSKVKILGILEEVIGIPMIMVFPGIEKRLSLRAIPESPAHRPR